MNLANALKYKRVLRQELLDFAVFVAIFGFVSQQSEKKSEGNFWMKKKVRVYLQCEKEKYFF